MIEVTDADREAAIKWRQRLLYLMGAIPDDVSEEDRTRRLDEFSAEHFACLRIAAARAEREKPQPPDEPLTPERVMQMLPANCDNQPKGQTKGSYSSKDVYAFNIIWIARGESFHLWVCNQIVDLAELGTTARFAALIAALGITTNSEATK